MMGIKATDLQHSKTVKDAEFITICDLTKRFGDFVAVSKVSFSVARGNMVSLLGPSGCGKTTLLRCIAGLESPNAGTIRISDALVSDPVHKIEVPPEKRSIGMVFQSYAIWPHMNVFQNVAFPLKLRRRENKVAVGKKVQETLKMVGLAGFADRPATDLSGGQQQRVALARALVAEPQLVLFDEPLSNLDAKLRDYMRVELVALQKRIGFTAIYVTHDQREALALSDQLIIMNRGRVEQKGAPFEIYKNPRTSFVADFMGASNSIMGRVVEIRPDDYVAVCIDDSEARFICRAEADRMTVGMAVIVSFRPESTQILLDGEADPAAAAETNRLPALVKSSLFLGEYFEYDLEIGNVRLKAQSRNIQPPPADSRIYLSVSPQDCLATPPPEEHSAGASQSAAPN